MMPGGLLEIISLFLNLVLGTGLIVTLITLKAAKREAEANAKKAEANAKASEIENVDAAVKIWRDLAEKMAERQNELAEQVDGLSIEVRRLKNATNKVVRLLDRITPENMAEMVAKIKYEIEKEELVHYPDGIADAGRLPIDTAPDSGTG